MKAKKVIKVILIAVFAIVIVICASIVIFAAAGKSSLERLSKASYPDMTKCPEVIQEGDAITYKGDTYTYNENMISILCMGIDARGESVVGQADMLALVCIDTEKKSITCICINRDTIGPVTVCDVAGKPIATKNMQLALSYSYGKTCADGRRLCFDSVSGLLHGLPISASCSLDIDGIGVINSLAGGVCLTALEDVKKAGLKKGDTAVLSDEQAFYYVTERKSRSRKVGTNSLRVERQKQYISGWCETVADKLKKNPFGIFDMYNQVKDYIDTDITKSQLMYLAWTIGRIAPDSIEICQLDGTYDRENYYDRYVADEAELTELIIDTFYRKAE